MTERRKRIPAKMFGGAELGRERESKSELLWKTCVQQTSNAELWREDEEVEEKTKNKETMAFSVAYRESTWAGNKFMCEMQSKLRTKIV